MEVSSNQYEKFRAYMLSQRSSRYAEDSEGQASKDSAYGLLVKIVTQLWDERPENPLDSLVDLGGKLLREKVQISSERNDQETLSNERSELDGNEIKEMCENLKKTIAMFKASGENSMEGGEGAATGEHLTCPIPDILDDMFYLKRVGVGLSDDEAMTIWISMRQLVELYESNIRKIRFWGKIFGTENDYYIIETEMEGEEEAEEDMNGNGSDQPEENAQQEEEEGSEKDKKDNENEYLPVPVFKKDPIPPSEVNTGPNKHVYFYCNDQLMKDWKKIPQVTPVHINESRQIKYFFTGNPLKIIKEGESTTELNILRAQIARISSATHVSPTGFYISNDDDSEEESDGGDGSDAGSKDNLVCNENIDFEEIPLAELSEPGLSNWSHHMPHILPQGRCVWWNPALAKSDKDGDGAGGSDGADDDKSGGDEDDDDALFGSKNYRMEPEVGPPLLTSLSEDLPLNGCPAWTIYLRCADPRQKLTTGLVLLKSQLWPGAYAMAKPGGRWHCNVYIGWGTKYEGSENFSPRQIQVPMLEFPTGKEVRELDDPSVEEEATQFADDKANGANQGSSDGADEDGDKNDEEDEEDDE